VHPAAGLGPGRLSVFGLEWPEIIPAQYNLSNGSRPKTIPDYSGLQMNEPLAISQPVKTDRHGLETR